MTRTTLEKNGTLLAETTFTLCNGLYDGQYAGDRNYYAYDGNVYCIVTHDNSITYTGENDTYLLGSVEDVIKMNAYNQSENFTSEENYKEVVTALKNI